MNEFMVIIRFVGRIAAAMLVSPTDEAVVDRDGFGRAYRIRTGHGNVSFSWREVL